MSAPLTLARLQLLRERTVLPIWVLGVLGLFGAAGAAVAREFAGEAERVGLATIAAGSPAFLFLRGLPDGSSVGALVFFQTFAFLSVLAALMNSFFVVRQTRTDEEAGRAELLEASAIARTASLRVTLALAACLNLLIAVGIAGMGLGLGFDPRAAVVTGLAVGSVGIAFAGVAAVASQVMPTPRGANGLAAGLVGASYLVRGVSDALGTAIDATHVESAWLSRLSPIGWAQASAPFSAADPLPLLVPTMLGLGLAALAVALRSRRDLGESLIAERAGRSSWHRASAFALAMRLQRSTVIGWAIGAAAIGFVAGAVSPLVATAVESNRSLEELIGRLSPGLDVDIQSIFAVALLGIAGFLAAAAGIQTIVRMRAEEAENRAELLLTTPLSRTQWLLAHLAVAVISMLVVGVAAGAAAGLGFIMAGEDAGRLPTSLAAVAVHLPAGLVFVAVTALIFAVLPRATAALGWGLLVMGLLVGQMGELFGLPEWLQALSPFNHVPAVPLQDVEPGWIVLLIAISLAIFTAAGLGLRRRDLPH